MAVSHSTSGGVCIIAIGGPDGLLPGLSAALDSAGAASRIVLDVAGGALGLAADADGFADLAQRLSALPAIAALRGTVTGPGFELVLACRGRVAHPQARFGLTGVSVGLVPGAGGTQRLPRLTGVPFAAAMIAEGRMVGAAEALRAGIVATVADDPLAAALALPLGEPPVIPPPEDSEAVRKEARRRLPGQTAPLRAIDLVEAAARLPLAEGLALERVAFLEAKGSEQAAALSHIHRAERAAQAPRADLPAPAPVATAIVVGGGTMGAGIAYALAGVGVHVTTVETGDDAVARARANIGSLYAEAVKRGKATQDAADQAMAGRHAFRAGYDGLPPADIAIEAAFEDMAVKHTIFAALDRALPETAILATNTSYLDVNAIFQGLRNPGRLLGLHFFAPAHVMKLVEVIRAQATSPATLATALGLATRLGKIAVQAGVCDGFIGNRILTRYRQTTDILLIEGATPAGVDAAMEGFGMAMGPYAVQDLSGLDIAFANRRRKGLRDRPGIRYVPIADRMVEDLKRLGRKTGAGWHDYDGAARRPAPVVEALVAACSAEAGITRRVIAPDEIRDQALLAMIEEGLHILEEGIARRPADIDVVLVNGYGFPRWRGGPMWQADVLGLEAVLGRLTALAARDPLSWRVPPLLVRLIEGGGTLGSLN